MLVAQKKRAARTLYHCPNEESRNVVAYIPELLAEWDGMCNVEIVLKSGNKPESAEDMGSNYGQALERR